MKIVLLGYMGSGKSTIGRVLAEKLDYRFLDLDDFIEQKEKMSIPELFKEKGEIYFRKKESEYITMALAESDKIILSLGGGTPCYTNNMSDILTLTPNVIYLKVSVIGLAQRLQKEKSDRPLIKNIPDADLPEFIGKHLFERSVFYQKANSTIECDNKTIDDIVSEIAENLV
ncbi:shikimate kinase [Aurantibacter crassamenti]|uniref:shikimate kinase n=1 Tax=Aurantibacter crassamenti TaxID=1837375 RepID=UPI00193A2C1F|nr:shikimate kinase [Aurantibacter crassamenti]MBM1106611.1 shikimate kinase [Aurantibacter crassamenti]